MHSIKIASAGIALLLSATPMLAQTSASPFGGSVSGGISHSASPDSTSAANAASTAGTSGTVGRLGGSVISGSSSGSASTPFTDCTGVNSVASPAAQLGCQ